MRWDLAAALVVGLVVGYVLAVALSRPQLVATPMSDAMPTDEHATPTGATAPNTIIATNVRQPLRAAPLASPSLHLVDENIDSLATA